ncbi:MAG: hypothetical protein ACFHWX_22825 [Bacteroidota bacterium]
MFNEIVSALERMTDGDKDFMKELAAAFESGFNEFLEDVVISTDNKDLVGFKAISHKIKPSFLTLGMDDEYQKIYDFGEDLVLKTSEEIEDFKMWVNGVIKDVNNNLTSIYS